MTDWPFKVLVGLLLVVLSYGLLGTERNWILHDRPTVAYLGEMKQPADMNMASVLDDYGIHLVRPETNFERALFGPNNPITRYLDSPVGTSSAPAVGRSIRELGFLGMPFAWWDDLGDVVYYENNRETVYAQLNPIGLTAVNRANGRNVFEGRLFPFWAHAWGWLWVLGVALAIWLWMKGQARRREELGII